MHEIFLPYWQSLENAKMDFIHRSAHLNEDQIHTPEDGGWSIAQVTEHILFSEEGTLGYMKKKTSSGWELLEEMSDAEKAAGSLLLQRLSGDTRLKAPSVLPEPMNATPWSILISRWDENRQSLKAFIEAVDPRYESKLVFRQPAAGMLNLNQTLQFLSRHIQHHYQQIDRIKSTFGWQ